MQRQRQSNKPWLKKIDFVFYHEQAIRDAVLDERNGLQPVNILNGSGISDPTARDAIRNLTPIPAITLDGREFKHPEHWLIVIEKTYAWAFRQSEIHFEVAKRRYNREDYRKTCLDLNISNTTRRNLLEIVQSYAALQAVQFRLIYID